MAVSPPPPSPPPPPHRYLTGYLSEFAKDPSPHAPTFHVRPTLDEIQMFPMEICNYHLEKPQNPLNSPRTRETRGYFGSLAVRLCGSAAESAWQCVSGWLCVRQCVCVAVGMVVRAAICGIPIYA